MFQLIYRDQRVTSSSPNLKLNEFHLNWSPIGFIIEVIGANARKGVSHMNDNPLNILHTIGLKALYPVIRCQLKLAGQLDVSRLIQAVNLTAKVVPELFCRYELADNSWQPVVTDAATLVQEVPADAPLDDTPDWFTQPQLRVQVQATSSGTTLTLTISHILTDGSGFKQYLYLLSDCYNRGPVAITGVKNVVELSWLKELLASHPAPQAGNVDHPAQPLQLPKLAAASTEQRRPQVSGLRLSQQLTRDLLTATHEQDVTVNDVLLATFGKTVQAYNQGNPTLAIACPTDMRQAIKHNHDLRIANHTARYNPVVTSASDEPIGTAVQKMHTEMTQLKQRDQFLDSVRSLMAQYQTLGIHELQQIVEANYHVREIGYTNFGVIDDQRLVFDQLPVTQCLLTGSFRTAPMFQVACSTFKGELSLGFNMIGTDEEVQFGRVVTTAMVAQIKAFVAQSTTDTVVL